MKTMRRGLLTLLLGLGGLAAAAADQLPGDSLYRLQLPLTTQAQQPLKMSGLAGKPAVITMFYGSCKLACPVTLHSMQSIVAKLPADKRAGVTALLVSLDPKGDNAATLAELAQSHDMAAAPWLFAVSDNDRDTRTFAAAVGLRYRRLASGEINHSTRIVVTDTQGRIVAATENTAPEGDPDIIEALKNQLH